MTAEPLQGLLAGNSELASLREQLERIRGLQKRYRTLAPPGLASSSRVCAIEGTTVVICAASGPVAAALRQIAPRLLQGLRDPPRKSLKQHGISECTAIRVEVQVEVPAPPRRVIARGKLPVEKLAAVGAGLADSELKTTLARITGAPQKRSTREKT